jgi:hypothetical protein
VLRWWVCDPGVKVFMTMLLDNGCIIEIGGHALHDRLRRHCAAIDVLVAYERDKRRESAQAAKEAAEVAGGSASARKARKAAFVKTAERTMALALQAQRQHLSMERNITGDVTALHNVAARFCTAFDFGVLPRLELQSMVKCRSGGRGMDGASKDVASSLRRAGFERILDSRCRHSVIGCAISQGTEAFSTVLCSCCTKRSNVGRQRTFRCSNQRCPGNAAGAHGGHHTAGRDADACASIALLNFGAAAKRLGLDLGPGPGPVQAHGSVPAPQVAPTQPSSSHPGGPSSDLKRSSIGATA